MPCISDPYLVNYFHVGGLHMGGRTSSWCVRRETVRTTEAVIGESNEGLGVWDLSSPSILT